MDITMDSSAILAVCTIESSKPRPLLTTRGAGLWAPTSVHWKIGNALSATLKRNRITLKQAHVCIDAYRQIPIRFVDVDLSAALALGHGHALHASDAYWLACARHSHTPLLTLDGKLRHAVRQAGIHCLMDNADNACKSSPTPRHGSHSPPRGSGPRPMAP